MSTGKCGNCGKPMEKQLTAENEICQECSGPDWSGKCEVCGQSPIVPITGLCGPCTFGDASTAGGEW